MNIHKYIYFKNEIQLQAANSYNLDAKLGNICNCCLMELQRGLIDHYSFPISCQLTNNLSSNKIHLISSVYLSVYLEVAILGLQKKYRLALHALQLSLQ